MSAYRSSAPREPGECECGRALEPMIIDGVAFSACKTCHESFTPVDSMVIMASSSAWQRTYLRMHPPPHDVEDRTVDRARACPVCFAPMEERKHYFGTREVIRACVEHGVWFDRDQLARVIVIRERRSRLLERPTKKRSTLHGPSVRNAAIIVGLIVAFSYLFSLILRTR